MKKEKLTEDKAEGTPAGGVLVGKRNGQTMIHNKGSLSGYLVGKTHAQGGIQAINKSTGQPLEMQGGEIIITAPAVSDNTKNEFNGKMMTNREILSTINEKGGGVSFAKGGDIPKDIKRTGASYKYGGKTMTDHEIYKHITGGHLAEGMTLTQIAKMHKVSVKELQKQVDLGMKAESEHTSSKREQMKIVKDHLYENPKYYSLLKKAGLKHGGRVHRGSLVRDAKSGNTPARDLNNYNDVMDLEADGMVGAETGLFANGGNVKPYDANMEGDSAKMIYARGGATDVIVNNWSDVPDSFKNVRLPKQIDWSPNPSNEGLYEIVKPFLGVEDLRPAMQGMNFDDNGITITNAHILLTIPTGEQSFDGIYKKDKSEDGFTKIDAKYPNYLQVIPTEKDITKVFQFINTDKLLIYCKVASKYTKGIITFKINDEQMSFTPEYIIGLISSWIKLTGLSYAFVSFQTNKRALIFSGNPTFKLGKDRFALLMPYIYGSDRKLGARNEDKKAELNVYYDFDDNEIHNSDGSVVTDWDEKPKKQRAKRTPKTTASKTSVPIDLIDKKIWVENNPDLSRRVQELAFENGFVNDKGTVVKYTDYSSIYLVKRATGQKYMYVFNYDKTEFEKEPETEIFESDLFPTAKTPTKETEKIVVFKMKGLSTAYSVYGATELFEDYKKLKFQYPDRELFPYRVYDIEEGEHDGIYFGKGIETISDLTVAIVNSPIYDNYDWTEFFAYGTESTSESSSKFTAGEIDMFNQIDTIVEENKFIKITTADFEGGDDTSSFFIDDSETGEVFSLRSYKNNLGVASNIFNIGEARNTLKKYLEWKKLTPTATAEIVEQPKPSKTDKPKRNFELERKYLSQRISDLAKELELKKPILSNEEVAFYQREINSFILKLRKLNDAEMSLKSIEERVRGVYGLKISSFDNQYPETDMTSINALKSQLTEKEYFNVRTPEFKSFFGDWETAYLNDSYAGVSKVINQVTKEPQPVFHGTNVLFVDWKTYDTNNAHYFAVKREMSEFFATTWEERTDKAGVDSEILKKLNPNRGSFLLRCFIDIKNPVDFSRFGVEKYPIREYLTFLRVNYNIGDFDFWTNITTHSGFTQDTEVYAWQIIRLWQSFTKYIKVFTMYDGYIFYEYIPTKPYGGLENASLSYCAFDSNQIKFADAYEFNALSNDSRFDLGGIL
jgi:hypothetical protein